MTVTIDWSTAEENPAQLHFLNDTTHRHMAFVGGLGSGKTWSGAMKMILYALANPNSLNGVMAPTYRQLRDSTMREFFKLLPNELIANWNKSEYELKLRNGSEILFRSLENYDSIRGIEFGAIWIDEGNLVSHKAWRVAVGRMRQPGFAHRCWITTTPRGKTGNWLYEEFVLKPGKNPALSRATYHARTRDNIQNVGDAYIADLEATYTGDFAAQELLGEFVDIIEGRVYPEFSREHHVDFFGENIFFDPAKPLYAFWDYGIGDAAALWLAQTIAVPAHLSIPLKNPEDPDGPLRQFDIPDSMGLVLIDLIMEEGENVEYWIKTIEMIEERWRPIDKHFGDPAGEQRTVTTGKSMAGHLREAGIFVHSKKLPTDQGRKMVVKLLTERRLFVSSDCELGVVSFTNYHWPLDLDGKRKAGSREPVHDWSSHPMDSLRYGITQLFPIFAPSPITRGGVVPGAKRESPFKKAVDRSSSAPRSSFIGTKDRAW